jgi:hypothetical protein
LILILAVHDPNVVPCLPVRQRDQSSLRDETIREVLVFGFQPDLHEAGSAFNDTLVGDLAGKYGFPFGLGCNAEQLKCNRQSAR